MTSNQIQFIVKTTLGYNLNEVIDFDKCELIVLNEFDRKKPDLFSMRFKFDTSNELLEIFSCQLYSDDVTKVPDHGFYDIKNINNKDYVFEYLVDNENNPIIDYVDYNYIILIQPKAGVLL